ncbi:maleylpyruvate isomerase N-terminal domain-containing protein [Phycicoccus sp. CSK15P-2]|uniref:maleylpyruvate isomerase N-terminal domain-containing protein n=1 Tax=Phycicoccus sp. CSK15P-2 TaxID=2807627 RepID=UPI001952788F|nr:maleylpyruvate isomerase N-terminal domain-containing protein [Phycicoccus sp. CSK15P-2]MBM6403601.1 maleylpyruvate isomerase N-terminal domain-containing protein [Phycicoccus sp. CSK15P-2]MBM6405066.1 maleylpyruvate isomerase N-terminal domain-containing protein [Phycicoccus sp. CSK15P-2]
MALSSVVTQYPEVAAVVARLVRSPEVARHWHAESACAGMTVGGLAHHVARQTSHVVTLLSAAPGADEVISVLDHYRRAAWVHTSLDDDQNVEIRSSADASAASGPDALLARMDADLEALPDALDPVIRGARVPDAVHLPWQGWSLSTADFLLTRTMECVVHTDDLAASVGLPTPELPAEPVREVLALLAAVAAERHGQVALVRALSRPQRAVGPVSAF